MEVSKPYILFLLWKFENFRKIGNNKNFKYCLDTLKPYRTYYNAWNNNPLDSIAAFTKTNPSLQDYEDQLKKFGAFEEEIDKISHSNLIGAIELKTENLC